MTSPVRLLTALYNASLRLFPVRYQDEYGEETKDVFAEACREAAAGSKRPLWRLALREARDLPVNLIREHLAEFKRGKMIPPANLIETLPQSARRGLRIFGIIFGTIYIAFCLIDVILNRGQTLGDQNSVWNTIIYIRWMPFAFGIGTAWLGSRTDKRRARFAGLALIPILYVFYRLWSWAATPLYFPESMMDSVYLSPAMAAALRTFLSTMQQVLVGLIVGAALAWIYRDASRWAWYGLLSAIGCILSFWCVVMLWILFSLFFQSGEALSRIGIGSVAYFTYHFLSNVPGGLVIGAFLGLAVGKRTDRVIKAATL